jgi:hypothetical protein
MLKQIFGFHVNLVTAAAGLQKYHSLLQLMVGETLQKSKKTQE